MLPGPLWRFFCLNTTEQSRLSFLLVDPWRLRSLACHIMGFLTTLFTSPPNENFVCSICHDVFENPSSCRCGHTFCRECLDEAIYGAEKCPICRAVIRKKDIFQNLVLRSLIGDLEMRCQNGCEWTSKVAECESHRKNDCGMQTIQCEVRGCDFQCLRKDMIHHVTSEEGIKAHVDNYVAERIAEIGAEVENEVTCKVKEVLLTQWLCQEIERAVTEKQRIRDALHFHLIAFCRQWVHFRPAALRDFVVYRPSSTARVSSLLCGIPGPTRTPWEGGLFPVHITWSGLDSPPTCKYPRHFHHVNVHRMSGQVTASFLDPYFDWSPTMSVPELLFGLQQHLAHPYPERASQTRACDSFLGLNNICYDEEVRKLVQRYTPSGDFLGIASKAFRRSFRSWAKVDVDTVDRCEWLESTPADGTECACSCCAHGMYHEQSLSN